MPATLHSRTCRADGLRLHLLESGSDLGDAILLLHGWPTNAQLWRHALPALGETRRAIALDLPGFGGSAKPLDASYSFRFFDRILSGLLDALGLDRVALVVHDLGGPVGLHWAAGHLSRVSELVLMNTLAFPEPSWAVQAFIAATHLPGVRRWMTSPQGIGAAMRFGVHDRDRITEGVARLYQRPFEGDAARAALLKTVHGLHPAGFETIARALSEIDVPVRIIYGEADRILPDVAQTMARVQAAVPHAELTAIPDCGHFLQEDQPHRVAALLVDFFGRSRASAA